ncbi:MAG TPA: hypothetical protein DDY31_08270, partial [Lachnospiraceae bacterium]|nr:hypothetical protein [Lachnospiraceae bacterium]
MTRIYIAFVDTPGFFAALIRKFLKQRYVHVVIAADAMLEEAYSVGRRTPVIPFSSGFEREDKNEILRTFPTAFYRICELSCTAQQRQEIMERLHTDWRKRFHIHYAVVGLPFIVMGIPFSDKTEEIPVKKILEYIRNSYALKTEVKFPQKRSKTTYIRIGVITFADFILSIFICFTDKFSFFVGCRSPPLNLN